MTASSLLRGLDRLVPVLFLLVDLEQELERCCSCWRALELAEKLLGAVEQARLEIVLRELEQRDQLLLRREVGALDQVLVHADRALDLAAAPEQAAQREMQLDRLRIDLDHLDERLDRLVGLLVEQEVEPLEIRQRQRARFRDELLDVDARGHPAEREEQRHREQPPVVRIPFSGCARCQRVRRYVVQHAGVAGAARTGRAAPSQRRGSRAAAGTHEPRHAATPAAAPSAKKTSSTKTSGACHSLPRK